MLMWIVGIVFGVIILFVSRKSIFKPNSHGFWRFFAWELMLILILLNLKYWFIHPWTWYQIIAWVLLFGCIVPLVLGVRTLVSRGKPVEQREGQPQLLAFEKTSALVTTGIYHYIRHPLYSSLLLLTWGVFFKYPAWLAGGLALAASMCLYLTAIADEAECINYFGESYRDYIKRTKRFIPFCF